MLIFIIIALVVVMLFIVILRAAFKARSIRQSNAGSYQEHKGIGQHFSDNAASGQHHSKLSEIMRKSQEESQKSNEKFRKWARDTAEQSRKNFDDARKRNEIIRKQTDDMMKRSRKMRGW